MPRITAGNHLYFYQLFCTEMGVGKQTPLARVEEILSEADVLLEDVECESIEELLGELSDFMKLTVFKKGRVFATVMAKADLDDLLEKAAQPTVDKAAAAAGKSWKRTRRSKDVRPTKPRHKRKPKPASEQAAPSEEPVSETIVEAIPEVTVEPQEESVVEEVTREVVDEKPLEAAEAQEAESTAASEPETQQELEASADAALLQEPEPKGEPKQEPVAKDEFEPEPEQVSESEQESGFKEESAPEPEDETEAKPVSKPKHELATEPEQRNPKRIRTTPKLRRISLPISFSSDVYCPDEQLFSLYQMLPDTIGIMDALDEGWKFAQQAGTIEGTRSRFSYPLSRTNLPGHPMDVTIARAARIPSGKAWKLVEVYREED